jgi:DNA-binding LytR/AlgR family response regulator
MPEQKNITCVAVDDEPPAIEVLKKYISSISFLELVACCNNAVEALHFLQTKTIDLLFLDIQMPQILGTDFLRTLKNPPKIIFTTAYRKFALEGFDLDAVDYLLKPVSFERFLKAVNKVYHQNTFITENSNEAETSPKVQPAFINLRCDRKMVKVPLHDILFIESLKDYIKVITLNNTIITKQPISATEEMLPEEMFLRIHRSYIVSINKIDSYSHELVWIAHHELPISRMYRHEVERVLKG